MKVVLGVAGGIAAYKAALLLRLLAEAGHEVTVVPTAAALRFVGEPTWAALSGRPVATDVWSEVHQVPHVRIGQSADLVVVAPATADLLARAAAGLADDLLTNTLLTARCPVVMAPAMHTEMWEHPATQANVETLTLRGVHVVPPAAGRLTGADSGPGRLPDPEHLFEICVRELSRSTAFAPVAGPRQDLRGTKVLVTAGGTREPLDPVRFLGNRSSGKQGIALAAAAARRGATVTLVLAHADVQPPPGMDVVRVGSALELEAATTSVAADHDVIVMAAAVADYRPAEYAAAKIKKPSGRQGAADGLTVRLVRNPDILAGLVAARGDRVGPLIVGFAAETGDSEGSVLEHARAKLERKGCDFLVVNEVGVDKAFGRDDNSVVILRRGTDEPVREVGPASKAAVADAVLDAVVDALGRAG